MVQQQQQRYVDPPIEDITYRMVADGTENYVNALFTDHNMEMILREMIRESQRGDEYGWLPASRLDEDDIVRGTPNVIDKIVQRYVEQHRLQNKDKYVTNLAVSKNDGQNHYCALWIDRSKRTVGLWDSATSAFMGSAFTNLFKKAAEILFTHPVMSTAWADRVYKVRATADAHYFQYGGGYLGEARSALAQNIFCHTWTLFFLELRLNGKTPRSIGCVRGSHPLLPLTIIKLYAQCLLTRMGKKMSGTYVGLKYVWDEIESKAIKLVPLAPNLASNGRRLFCAKRVVDTAIRSVNYTATAACSDVIYL
jgi:hypothetical protein